MILAAKLLKKCDIYIPKVRYFAYKVVEKVESKRSPKYNKKTKSSFYRV